MIDNYVNYRTLQLFAEAAGSESGVTEVGAQPQAEAPSQGREDFEKLIQGPYKEAYNARVQSILRQRLKNSRETAEKFAAAQPVLQYMQKALGMEGQDYGAMEKALRERLPEQPEPAEQQRQTQEIQAGAEQMLAQWHSQAQTIRETYPDFDLEREMLDPGFRQLLRARVDMQTAYEIRHKEEIIPAAMAYAAQRVEKHLAEKLRSGGNRPPENGLTPSGAAPLGNRVEKLSRKELAELCRRVERGEKISFN